MPSTLALDVLGLGTMKLRTDGLDAAFAVLDTWRDAGGRLLDTAAVYGQGESERAIGAWLRARGARGDVTLLTKGAHPDLSDWVSRMTPEAIDADLTGSLERLGVPSVDAYLVHRDDTNVPVAEIIDVLASHVAAGRVDSYGVSNWTLPRLETALAHIAANGLPPLTWSSSYLGLATPIGQSWPGVVDASDTTSRDWYATHPVRLLAWSPGGNGYFAADADLGAKKFDAYRTSVNAARRERTAELAGRRGLTPSQVALAWVIRQSCAPVALVGTTSLAHLTDAIAAVTIDLTTDELRWLEHGDDLETPWTS